MKQIRKARHCHLRTLKLHENLASYQTSSKTKKCETDSISNPVLTLKAMFCLPRTSAFYQFTWDRPGTSLLPYQQEQIMSRIHQENSDQISLGPGHPS